MACLEDSQATCPTYSEVVASGETRPPATCVAIVYIMFPASHVCFATVQVLASTTLTKIKCIFPEETSAISCLGGDLPAPTCAHNKPSVSSIATSVPEHHPGSSATLKHLKPDIIPPSTKMPGGLAIAPAMQPIVVDGVPIVDPQLAAIV
jgi:hypothetical protein